MVQSNDTWRYEKKYYINLREYLILKNRIKYVLRNDENSINEDGYHIRSIYFDDINNSSLFNKLSGIDSRHKYRIRIYNFDDKVIKLEKKLKRSNFIRKESCFLNREQANNLLNGNIKNLSFNFHNDLLKEVYIQMNKNLLKPIIIVDYIREAFTHLAGNVRITFDKKLSTGLYSKDLFNNNISTFPALDEPLMILEVKYNNFIPKHIQDILQLPFRQQIAISKYAICRKHIKFNDWEDE